MGREVYTIIKDPKGSIVWDSADKIEEFFCGRNAATNVLAHYIDWDNRVEEPEHGILIDITDPQIRAKIEHDLREEQDKMDYMLDNVNELISDLREARRHAVNTTIFFDFTEEIDVRRSDIRDTYWTCADDMCKLMHRTVSVAAGLAHSQLYHNGEPELDGYTIYWVFSE